MSSGIAQTLLPLTLFTLVSAVAVRTKHFLCRQKCPLAFRGWSQARQLTSRTTRQRPTLRRCPLSHGHFMRRFWTHSASEPKTDGRPPSDSNSHTRSQTVPPTHGRMIAAPERVMTGAQTTQHADCVRGFGADLWPKQAVLECGDRQYVLMLNKCEPSSAETVHHGR
jgi:hypothetical protein